MEFRSPFGLNLPPQPPLVGAPPGIPPLPPGIQPPSLAGSLPKPTHLPALGKKKNFSGLVGFRDHA